MSSQKSKPLLFSSGLIYHAFSSDCDLWCAWCLYMLLAEKNTQFGREKGIASELRFLIFLLSFTHRLTHLSLQIEIWVETKAKTKEKNWKILFRLFQLHTHIVGEFGIGLNTNRFMWDSSDLVGSGERKGGNEWLGRRRFHSLATISQEIDRSFFACVFRLTYDHEAISDRIPMSTLE